jgi:hypothetical protein
VTDIVVAPSTAPANLYGADSPRDLIARASGQAEALADVIRSRRLSVNIGGREYVRVEGWTLLGVMLGVSPVCEWTRPLPDGTGWEARVVARTLDGREVGAAEAMCSRDEPSWSRRPEYALRSMAQTRATAKALRLPLGFVMALAGYETTPAEEMEVDVPVCAEHGKRMQLRPGGVSKQTGRPYPPFYRCPVRGCKQMLWQHDWRPNAGAAADEAVTDEADTA